MRRRKNAAQEAHGQHTAPSESTSGQTEPGDEIIADRYRVVQTLGQGGAGTAFEVFDRSLGRNLVLKRLCPDAATRRPVLVDLFQNEFQTLCQLSHPQIIEVYDYGVDAVGPYYTMEMLSGGDLKEMAPVPWQRACTLLCEVASSLAILHARRLLHNDVAPKNVRLTEDGRAKLIDFGAMTPMGTRNYVVGAPAFVPPEAVDAQPLDGRSDLFSLGALAYWLLTRHHAFPARTHADLRSVWQQPPAPPSAIVPDIPNTLDNLVLALLSLDPLARPVSAAEVIDRLGAIAGLPATEEVGVAQSYLTTPVLVARDELLVRFRHRMRRARNGRGGALLLEAEEGMGRTRLLANYEVEAKLWGASVLRATAGQAEDGDYGVLASLFEDLLESLPDDALRAIERAQAEILARISPSLRECLATGQLEARRTADYLTEAESESELHSEVERAATRCLLDLADSRCLMIAVDDVHRCDAGSAAVLARLAHSAEHKRLVVVATAELDAPAAAPKALEILRQTGSRVRLQPFDLPNTHALVTSIFGKVENIGVIASWIYRLAGGNPKASMELAQHLVDREVACFESGAWRLPAQLQDQALPRSFGQALELRLAALDADARTLAECLAVATEQAPLCAADCVQLLSRQENPSEDQGRRAFRALGELVGRQIVSQTGGRYRLAQRGSLEVLRRSLDGAARRAVHAALARAYQARDGVNAAIIAYHLQHSGQTTEALAYTLTWVRDLDWDRASDFQLLMSPLGREVLEAALSCAESEGASPLALYQLRRCLLDVALRADPSAICHADAVFEQLQHESGLIFWAELEDESLDPAERIKCCMGRAQALYDATPEARRGLSPLDAILAFARFASTTCAVYGRILDLDRLVATRDLLLPLHKLSPVADAMHEIVSGSVEAAVLGQDVSGRRARVIETLNAPLAGMADDARVIARYTLIYFAALDEVSLSSTDALTRADYLESCPGFEAMAWQIRRLWNLCNGDAAEAKRCGEHMELLAIRSAENHMALTMSLVQEARIFAAAGDLMELKRLLPHLKEQADRFPGWQRWVYLVTGWIHLLRGEYANAHAELTKTLSLVGPQRDGHTWLLAMGADLEALVGLSAYEVVKTRAAEALAARGTIPTLPLHASAFQVPLAYAEAMLGDEDAASVRLDNAIARAESDRLAPLFAGNLIEARARLAIWAGESEVFRSLAERLEEQYCSGHYPALAAKFTRLMEEARRAGVAATAGASSPAGDAQWTRFASEEIWSQLDQCRGPEERARASLQILIDATGAEDGYLYTLQGESLTVAASLHGDIPSAQTDERAKEYLSSSLADVTEWSGAALEAPDDESELERRVSLVLLSAPREREELVVGIAALQSGVRPLTAQVVGAVCDYLLGAGDVTPLVAALR